MKRRVLVVDDHAGLRSAVRFLLERRGFEVDEASTAEAALAAVEELRPHLVVLDHLLGGSVTGLELAAVVSSGHVETRVVILSAYVDDGARFAGADAVLGKARMDGLADLADELVPPPPPR